MACALWIQDLNLIARSSALAGTPASFLCLDGIGEPLPFEVPPGMLFPETGSLWLMRGARKIQLWPMAVFDQTTMQAPDSVRRSTSPHAQIYSRQESVWLAYTPLGAEGFSESHGGQDEWQAFQAMFSVMQAGRAHPFEVPGFEKDLRKDSAEMVGREKEITRAIAEIKARTDGLVWITGSAGMGKSFLMARIFTEFEDDVDAAHHVFAYRFRAGDDRRCSRAAFATFLDERLRDAGLVRDGFKAKKDAKPEMKLETAFNGLPLDQHLTLLLDGLDELVRTDPKFVEEMIGSHPRVRWVCAGRPEPALVQAMRERAATDLFPDGLPPMAEDDIRGMILNKIGPLRKKLLQQDKEDAGQVLNPFVSLVTQRAGGLPLYVRYVIGDVLNGKYRVLDGAEDLPESLHAYHEKLLKQLGIGDLEAVLAPVVAVLALAHEPLAEGELHAFLAHRKLLPADESGQSLLARGIAALASMLKTAPDPDGETGFVLFHNSLRDHVRDSATMSNTVRQTREALADLAEMATPPVLLEKYLLRCGVRHLLDDGRNAEAERLLLDVNYFFRMIGAGVGWTEILNCWESCGADKAPLGYSDAIVASLARSSSPRDTIAEILGAFQMFLYGSREIFLFHTGLFVAALLLPGDMRREAVDAILASMKKISKTDRDWSDWLDGRCLAAGIALHGLQDDPSSIEVFSHASRNETETLMTLLSDAGCQAPSSMLEGAVFPTDINSEQDLEKHWASGSASDDDRAQDLMAFTLKLRKSGDKNFTPLSAENKRLLTRLKYPDLAFAAVIAALREAPRADEMLVFLQKTGESVAYYYWNAKGIEKCAAALFDAGFTEKSLALSRLTNSLSHSPYILICLDGQKYALAATELLRNALRPAFSSWIEKPASPVSVEENIPRITGKERLETIRETQFTFDCEKPEAMSHLACDIAAEDPATARQAIAEAIELVTADSRYACRTLGRILRDAARCGFQDLAERALARAIPLCAESNDWFEQAEKWEDLLTAVPDVRDVIKSEEWRKFLESVPSPAQEAQDERHSGGEQNAVRLFNIASVLQRAGETASARRFIKASPALPSHMSPDIFDSPLFVDIETLILEQPASIDGVYALLNVARHYFAGANRQMAERHVLNAVDRARKLDAYWRSRALESVVSLLCDNQLVAQAEDYLEEITEDWALVEARCHILVAGSQKEVPVNDLRDLITSAAHIGDPHSASIAQSSVSRCLSTIADRLNLAEEIDAILGILQLSELSHEARENVIERILASKEMSLPVLKKIQRVSQESDWPHGIQSRIFKAIRSC
jgi:hypothetical protein